LSQAEIKERFPHVDAQRVSGGTFCGIDGFIKDPASIALTVSEHLEERGVIVCKKTTVFDIQPEDGAIVRVRTSLGDITTTKVVVCAGAWSGPLAVSVGTYLDVLPFPRQLTFTSSFTGIARESCPMTITPTGAYIRPNRDHFYLGYAPPNTQPSFRPRYDESLQWQTVEMLAEYMPVLADAEIRGGDCGLYEVSMDHNAIIGDDPQVPGLYYLTGFSGHGIMHAPGAALLLAELIVYGQVRSLSPEMFKGLSAERISSRIYFPESAVI